MIYMAINTRLSLYRKNIWQVDRRRKCSVVSKPELEAIESSVRMSYLYIILQGETSYGNKVWVPDRVELPDLKQIAVNNVGTWQLAAFVVVVPASDLNNVSYSVSLSVR